LVGIKDADFVFELLPELDSHFAEGQFVVSAKANAW
jgi:hypothetical protein